jgi:eukaryotic-like serine/threonine-protein kinase
MEAKREGATAARGRGAPKMSMKTGFRLTESERQGGAGESRYRVIEQLGRGGVANVFLAVARGPIGFNKLVVLKTPREDLAVDPYFFTMFFNEARLAARLNHPNVVQTYEVGEDAGRPVIVMEYLEGAPLNLIHSRVRRDKRPFTLQMELRVLADVLAGLHYAHELADFDGRQLNLVHRDVSPQNVFVSFQGQVKVLDFGIAKAAVGTPAETRTGIMKGKVRYMAPEQIAGEPLDRRADIYSVGAMLWAAATQRALWAEFLDVTVMLKVMHGDIPPPSSVRADVPPEIDRICLKAMARNREDRYATALDMERDLDQALTVLGDVKSRAIGDFIADVFERERAERKALIESQLSESVTQPAEDQLITPPISPIALQSQFPPATNGPGATGSRSQAPPGEPPRRTGRVVAILGLAVVIAAAAVGVIWMLRTRGRDAEASRLASTQHAVDTSGSVATPAAVSASASTITSQENVAVKISTVPSFAKIYIDGAPVPANPYSASLGRDGSRHRVRAEARAYVTRSADITLDQDVNLVLTLERERVLPNPAYRQSSPPASTAVPSAPPKPDCAQPYYVDEKGIKKIRAECL